MSTLRKRLPVRVRLKLASLQLLLRFVKSRAFRLMLMPFIFVWVRYRMYSVAFGATPKSWTVNPQTARVVRQLEALRNAPIEMDGATDKKPRLSQAMTWGVAGFALSAHIQIAK